jgi:hypothetical protein
MAKTTFFRCIPLRAGAFFASFILVAGLSAISRIIYYASFIGDHNNVPDQPPLPVGVQWTFRIASTTFYVLSWVSIIGLLGVACRVRKIVWVYKKLLVFTRDLSIVAGIAGIVYFIVSLERAANGSLGRNIRDCIKAVEEAQQNGTDQGPRIPDTCYLAIEDGVAIGLSSAWCAALCFMLFWSICAQMAVSQYYKELSEDGHGHIALDESADYVLTNDLPQPNENANTNANAAQMAV